MRKNKASRRAVSRPRRALSRAALRKSARSVALPPAQSRHESLIDVVCRRIWP